MSTGATHGVHGFNITTGREGSLSILSVLATLTGIGEVYGKHIQHMGSNTFSGLGLDLESVLMSFESS